MLKRGLILFLASTLFFSCAPKALREAEEVVAQADSMRAAGQVYADSVRLAQAYETLGAIPLPFTGEGLCPIGLPVAVRRTMLGLGSSYAHACYHYGRLLREKDNPVEAMQCFINASHTRTRDYHILGRVYSNMGSICHLVTEFALAYDMYEHSAEMFLHNGDSTAYFYALNDMAFELAEQGKKEEAFRIISRIENFCTDAEVITKTLETKAEACLYAHQYDSILYYTDLLYSNNSRESHIFLLRAKAFTFLGQKDSAVYYANYVLSISDELFNKNSALYILTQDDESKDKQDIRMTSAERSDTQKLIEIRRGKLSQAVQLLEQDLHRKPNLAWLYAICATLAVVGLVAFLYVYRKRRQHALLSQQVNALEEQHEQIVQEHSIYTNKLMAQVEETCTLLRQSPHLSKDLYWNDFESMCHSADQRLFMIASKLRQKQILNETEVRLCILVLLDLNRKQISDTLPYSLNSVGKLKDHTAKLLGTTGKNLRDFLLNMAVER